ncbi:hypothetical protein SKAU_G00304480 [Synaphobranchus kaupii]|uniref:Uncharacterized protein n=1 Tax=Synaphobranchus kaupii TaxID=118154 RepID=A0A9Q1ILG8_SYNKA|nr:hypothetical protein SKAU_G00304480 [Synaphobranchus kaupii]
MLRQHFPLSWEAPLPSLPAGSFVRQVRRGRRRDAQTLIGAKWGSPLWKGRVEAVYRAPLFVPRGDREQIERYSYPGPSPCPSAPSPRGGAGSGKREAWPGLNHLSSHLAANGLARRSPWQHRQTTGRHSAQSISVTVIVPLLPVFVDPFLSASHKQALYGRHDTMAADTHRSMGSGGKMTFSHRGKAASVRQIPSNGDL